MRLLRLDLGDGQSTLDLHPLVTVARNLSTAQLGDVLESVRSLARGSTAGIRGLVEHQGLLLDLDGAADERFLSITAANVVLDCDAIGDLGLVGLESQIERTRSRAEIDAVIVEEIRADFAPAARAKVAELEAHLSENDDTERIAAMESEIKRVSDAVAAVQSLQAVVYEAPEDVLTLRRRWDAHAERRAAAEEHFATLMNAVQQSETRAAKAREALELAREEAKPALLTREEEARLELLSFPEQDESRRGKWRRTLRDEEEAEKQALLAKVGVDSWTGYTMHRLSPSAPPERVEAAATAERNLVDAEANLAEVRANLASDELTAELNDEADEIRSDAREYLGQLLPADIGKALHELVIEKPNPTWVMALDELRELLEALGIAINIDGGFNDGASASAGLSRIATEIVGAAEAWTTDRRRERIDFDFDSVRSSLEAHRRELERHERALRRIERAELAAASSAERLSQLERSHAAMVDGTAGSAEAILALVEPVAGQVLAEAEGSVPLAILGRFDGVGDDDVAELMDGLEALAERLQIVVVSEHAAVAAWAESAGLERALVSRPKVAGSSPSGQRTAA